MKLENQVCTLEQAKKFEELGVNAPAAFYWRYPTNKWIVEPKGYFHEEEEGVEWLPAYTVAELGVMLPEYYYSVKTKGSKDLPAKWGMSNTMEEVLTDRHRQTDTDEFILGNAVTEAITRAAMLIYLLENNLSTPEEVNERIKNE